MFLKRTPRTRLLLFHPNIAETIEKQQANQRKYHDSTRQKLREFKKHDTVQVRCFLRGTEKWKCGIVIKRLGPLNYLVKMSNQTRKVHVEHLLSNDSSSSGLIKLKLKTEILFHWT